jgi:hypothetical protein
MPVRNERMSSGLYGAAQQVGRNPVERLTWLLELSQMGDEELARRDPHDLLDEIMFLHLPAATSPAFSHAPMS